MKNHSIETELLRLEAQMATHHLAPNSRIIADGQWQEYTVMYEGKPRKAIYLVIQYPLESNSDGPILIAHYGFTDQRTLYSYSSLQEKK